MCVGEVVASAQSGRPRLAGQQGAVRLDHSLGRARPVADWTRRERRGRHRAQHGVGEALRRAWLPPLLGGGAPRFRHPRQLVAGDPHHAPGGGNRAHQSRLRRRDALALFALQGGRELPPAGGALSGAHRSGRWPRSWQRRLDRRGPRLRQSARHRILSGEGEGPHGVRRRQAAADRGVPRSEGDASRRHRAGSVDARLQLRQRGLRGALRHRLLPRPLHRSAASGGGAAPIPAELRAGALD